MILIQVVLTEAPLPVFIFLLISAQFIYLYISTVVMESVHSKVIQKGTGKTSESGIPRPGKTLHIRRHWVENHCSRQTDIGVGLYPKRQRDTARGNKRETGAIPKKKKKQWTEMKEIQVTNTWDLMEIWWAILLLRELGIFYSLCLYVIGCVDKLFPECKIFGRLNLGHDLMGLREGSCTISWSRLRPFCWLPWLLATARI